MISQQNELYPEEMMIKAILATILACFVSLPLLTAEEDFSFDTEGYDYMEQYPPQAQGESLDIRLSVGMVSQGFGAGLSCEQELVRYLYARQELNYFRDDQNEASPEIAHEMNLGILLAPLRNYTFSPFVSIAAGYSQWSSLANEGASLQSGYDIGVDMSLTDFFHFVVFQKELRFLDEKPLLYWGKQIGEQQEFSQTQAEIQFRMAI